MVHLIQFHAVNPAVLRMLWFFRRGLCTRLMSLQQEQTCPDSRRREHVPDPLDSAAGFGGHTYTSIILGLNTLLA